MKNRRPGPTIHVEMKNHWPGRTTPHQNEGVATHKKSKFKFARNEAYTASMASRKRHAEGIAMLSMYGDEDDEEMEDIDDEELQEEEPVINEYTEAIDVDVGLSDEHEEEMETSEGILNGAEIQDANGNIQVSTPNVQEMPQLDTMGSAIVELEALEVEGVANPSLENADPLDKFLPPPPNLSCSEEIQERINYFLSLKKNGRSFNDEVRNRKDYRNPDFLLRAVRYQDIDQIGSCFSKDVFDPYGYDSTDYFEEIETGMRLDKERKEQQLKRSPHLVIGGSQNPTVSGGPKYNMPTPGGPTVTSGGFQSAANAGARDSRQNRKSKWDKVGDN